MEPDLGNIDGNVLIPFRLQSIHQKGPFERHPPPSANGLNLFEFTFRERTRVMQKPAYQGRFSMIDVANDDNPERVSAGTRREVWRSHMYPLDRSRSKASSDSWS
jgi:hypothetical protein